MFSRAVLIARTLLLETRILQTDLGLPDNVNPISAEYRGKREGGYSAGAPPLSIPNREVKPRSVDGTARAGEQNAATLRRETQTGTSGSLFFGSPLKGPTLTLPGGGGKFKDHGLLRFTQIFLWK